MDPSALIFVALAVAWAVYLIPKALEHHEEGARTRTVERFSKTMRVLARREPVDRRTARLVPEGASATTAAGDRTASRPPAPEPAAAPSAPLTPVQARARRARAAAAARRRLRVVTLILLANVVVAVLAYVAVVAWAWCAVPVGLLVAWLVACRLMVKRERAERPVRSRLPAGTPLPTPATPAPSEPSDETGTIEAVTAEEPAEEPVAQDPESWDPVPVTLPTYVSKAAAPRSVRTIDLDSTGVWSSGRSESDSALAREAEAADRVAKERAAVERQRRASS